MNAISAAGLSMPMMRRAVWASTHDPNIIQGPVAPVENDRVWVVFNSSRFSRTSVTYPATITAVHYRDGSSSIIDTVHVQYFDGDTKNTHRNVDQVFFRHEIAPGDVVGIGERFLETYDDDAEERRYQRHLALAREEEAGTGEEGEARAVMQATLTVGISSRARIAEMARTNSPTNNSPNGSVISRGNVRVPVDPASETGQGGSASTAKPLVFRMKPGVATSQLTDIAVDNPLSAPDKGGSASMPTNAVFRMKYGDTASQLNASMSKKATVSPHKSNVSADNSLSAARNDPDTLAAAAVLAATVSAETYAAAMAVLNTLYPPNVLHSHTSNVLGIVDGPPVPSNSFEDIDPRSLEGLYASRAYGSPSRGRGSLSRGRGSLSRGRGSPSRGRGSPSRGLGSPSRGRGSPSRGRGSRSRSRGSARGIRGRKSRSHSAPPTTSAESNSGSSSSSSSDSDSSSSSSSSESE